MDNKAYLKCAKKRLYHGIVFICQTIKSDIDSFELLNANFEA
jgi:hypothetical protein